MSERRKNSSKNRTVAYVSAGVIHAALIGALLVNFNSEPTSVKADFAEKVDTVKATTISESEIRKQQDKLKEADKKKKRDSEREKQRLKDLQQQSELEQKQIEELKQLQKKELDRTKELELQREAIALKKKEDEEKRRKELEEQKKRDAIAKKKRLEKEKREKQRLRELEEKRIQAEEQERLRQQEMDRILREEQIMMDARIAAERRTTLIGKYTALIKRKVDANFTKPAGVSSSAVAEVLVHVYPDGRVRSVKVVKASGTPLFDRAAENAVYKASPLPLPSVEEDAGLQTMFVQQGIQFSTGRN